MDCNVQGSPEAKKPCKGILKTSSSFDKHSVSQRRKSTKFDELNVLQTYHPPDKDYGHMKIEEPKTPFNYANPEDQTTDQLDAEDLVTRLKMTEPRKSIDATDDDGVNDNDDDDDDDSSGDEYKYETDEEKQKRLEFEKRRKLHYNEFEAIKLARKLIEEEDDEDDDGSKPESSLTKSSDEPGPSETSARAANEIDMKQ